MKKTIELEWPILPGSISTARSRCGKARCACKLRSPRLHGIYYRWTGFIGGKRTTKTVSKEVEIEGLDGPEMGVLGYPDFQLHPSGMGITMVGESAVASKTAERQGAKVVVEQN